MKCNSNKMSMYTPWCSIKVLSTSVNQRSGNLSSLTVISGNDKLSSNVETTTAGFSCNIINMPVNQNSGNVESKATVMSNNCNNKANW